MKKIELRVNKCEDCPFCSPEFGFHEKIRYYCTKSDKYLSGIRSIPKFCPLDDVKKHVAFPVNTD